MRAVQHQVGDQQDDLEMFITEATSVRLNKMYEPYRSSPNAEVLLSEAAFFLNMRYRTLPVARPWSGDAAVPFGVWGACSVDSREE